MSTFNLFVYGSLRSGDSANDRLAGSELIGPATVHGTLYDIDGRFRAIMLYGTDLIHGEVWRCPVDLLRSLDEYEGTATGLFRRIGTEVDGAAGERVPCWTYVAGPALSRKITPDRRVGSSYYIADLATEPQQGNRS